MQRVVGLALAMVLVMGVVAMAIAPRTGAVPAGPTAPAPLATDDGQDAGPWALHPRPGPARPHPASISAPAAPAGDGAIVLARGDDGQFHLTADVNGQPVSFLVDTGADRVALTREAAQSLGLAPPESAFRPIVHTASGTGMAAPVVIDRLQLGNNTMRAVPALVADGLGQNLLGQSALAQLGAVQLSGNTMTITPSR